MAEPTSGPGDAAASQHPSATARGRHRGAFRAGVGAAVALVVLGVVLAVHGSRSTVGPAATVRGYFAALQRADAPAALGYGPVPAGPHALLTSTVLRAQQRLAPLRDLRITAVQRTGDTATVAVRYTLDFAADAQVVSDSVRLTRHGSRWRLVTSAADARLNLIQASARASIVGTPVPTGPVLLFPGAVPVGSDTPYLAVDPADAIVRRAASNDLSLAVQVSPAGRAAVTTALTSALHDCLAGTGSPDPLCPLPSDRYVPGSLRGSATAVSGLTLTVGANPAGSIQASTTSVIVTGRYRVLDFDNRPVSRTGSVRLPIAAHLAAQPPAVVGWTATQ